MAAFLKNLLGRVAEADTLNGYVRVLQSNNDPQHCCIKIIIETLLAPDNHICHSRTYKLIAASLKVDLLFKPANPGSAASL